MKYRLELTRGAVRDLKKLPNDILKRVDAYLLALAENPFPPASKKLTGSVDFYRIRIGDYRVIYSVEGKRLIVLVIRVRHRREVYRS